MTDTFRQEEATSLEAFDQNKSSSNDLIQIEKSEETSILIEEQAPGELTNMHTADETAILRAISSTKSFLANEHTQSQQDISYLHGQIKKLQKLLLNEQDKFTKLQNRLQNSESQRFLTMSETNKDISSLNSQITKARSELEKSEALRQALEYELTVTKSSFHKERQICMDKEKMLEEMNKNLESKLSVVNKENIDLKSKFQLLDNEYSKELTKFRASLDEKEKFLEKFQTEQDLFERERETLNDLIKEQERLNSQYKEEILSHKDVIRKLCAQLENVKEKEEKVRKDHEAMKHKLKSLENQFEKEKANHSELKFNMNIEQAKLKDTNEQLIVQEKLKKELELNITKLIEQLKENRKELNEEQSKNRELKERFKICENQFKTLNNDITQKLEEKVNTIKKLSLQLSEHENNFKEIKHELKQTQEKQHEIDDTYEETMKELDYLIKCFTIKTEDKQQLKSKQIPVVVPNIAYKIQVLKITLDEYKEYVTKKFNGLHDDINKMEDLTKENEALKEAIQTKEKSFEKLNEVNKKHENDMAVLRKEREALDEVISSLRAECETFKVNLSSEYEASGAYKKQIAKLTKSSKQMSEKKEYFYQSIYKRVMPLFGTIGTSDDNLNEHDLEEFIDDIIDKLIYYVENFDEKLNRIEKNLKTKDEQIEVSARKYEEQIQKLVKNLKEKECMFKKQKDSLVNYYEQLINDVNSRVKLNEISTNEAIVRLRDSENEKRRLEREINQMRNALVEKQNDLSSMKTICLLVYGVLEPLIYQNKELKEQRKLLEVVNSRWTHFHNQIIFIQDNVLDKIMLKDTTSCSYNSSKTLLDNIAEVDVINNSKAVKNKHLKSSKVWLFRKIVLVILAMNRLMHFKCMNQHKYLIMNGLRFFFKDLPPVQTSISDTLMRSEANNDEFQTQPKLLRNWFTLNSLMDTLKKISQELNKCLYDEEYHDEENIFVKTQQAMFEILRLSGISPMNQSHGSTKSLCARLKNGIKSIIAKNHRIGKCFSLEMTIESLNDDIVELKRRFIAIQMSTRGTPKQSKSVDASILDDRFNNVCRELENALNREKQAEILLNEQSSQLQELSQKLAEYSTHELLCFRLKNELQPKDLAVNILNKNLNTTESYFDKDILIAYCENIKNHVQTTLRQLLVNNNFNDAMNQIEQLKDFNAQVLDEKTDFGQHREIFDLYHNLVTEFCGNSEILLQKVSSKDVEINLMRDELGNLKDELNRISKSTHTSKISPLQCSDFDTSFHQLPKFRSIPLGDGCNSAFKPVPIRLLKSSTPTTQEAYLNL